MEKKYEAIILFGPPGTGKGTQAKLLEKTGKFFHFSTGYMLRNLNHKTTVGRKVKDLIDKGNFVPDELIFELFDETLAEYIAKGKYNHNKQIIILDGVPRTVKQVSFINNKFDIKKIFYLKINNKLVIERTTKKRTGIESRVDDNDSEIVKKRLETYKKETLPVLNKYDKKLIVEIDGSKSVEEINKKIISSLNKQL